MKKTKMFYGNQFVGSFNCDGRNLSGIKYQLFLAKRMAMKCLIASLVIVISAWVFTAGIYVAKATIEPTTVYGKEIIEVPITVVPPVMERIAKCESNNQHYRNGQVIFNSNKDGTVDIGLYQINSIHSKNATKLGFDLTKEEDNKAYAMYLYANHGTELWYSSVKCWNK